MYYVVYYGISVYPMYRVYDSLAEAQRLYAMLMLSLHESQQVLLLHDERILMRYWR